MKLSVIIVSYNVRYYLEQCLRSLQEALRGIESEILVVDNQSDDDSVPYLSTRFPDAVFIQSPHNLGFAKANNLAIRQSSGEYVLLLNPDTIVSQSALKECLDFMEEHSGVGGTGVRMMKTNGADALESRRGIPTPMVAFYKMCGLCARYPKSRRFGKYYMGYLPWDKPAEIEVISGAYCMLRRAALDQVGLLDETFFMYGEDVDLSFRLRKANWQNWYVPSRILHYKGESTQKTSYRYVHIFYRAMLIFFRKHYSGMSLLLSVPIKMAIFLKAISALLSMELEKIKTSLGLWTSQQADPVYLMIGDEAAVADFQRFAMAKGLQVRCIVGDCHSLPSGHLDRMIDHDGIVHSVYDTMSYSYTQMLEIFAKNDRSNVKLGTYDRRQHILITEGEVIR
ncbi:MAG: glycosyltransferase family 2 protein [Prevotella sp.]|nr:glycosyltransferase family 2 protein [Prevotella sp.]